MLVVSLVQMWFSELLFLLHSCSCANCSPWPVQLILLDTNAIFYGSWVKQPRYLCVKALPGDAFQSESAFLSQGFGLMPA